MVQNENTHRSLLIVEPNPVDSRIVAINCRPMFSEIHVAKTAFDAIVTLGTQPYDCVVMECRLPHVTGLQIARMVRSAAGTPNQHTPILAVTADVPRLDEQQCLAAGMSAFLPKPFMRESLVAQVRRLVSHRYPLGCVNGNGFGRPNLRKTSFGGS